MKTGTRHGSKEMGKQGDRFARHGNHRGGEFGLSAHKTVSCHLC